MQRPGPSLVSAAAEPAIELLFETPRRSSGLRWRTAGGANKGLLVDSPMQYLDTTRPKIIRYFETARNWTHSPRALTALKWYHSSCLCVALKSLNASQEQSRQYCHSCRWALIWVVSATNSWYTICSKAHSTGVAEQSRPRLPVPDGPNALPRPRYTIPPAAHSAQLLTYYVPPELLIFNSILVVPACSAHVFAHQLGETLW